MPTSTGKIIADTQVWLENAVIGLNLCPFAKAVFVKRQIRYSVSAALSADELLLDLKSELLALSALGSAPSDDPDTPVTTLLVHPHVLNGFHEYNEFLATADAALEELDLTGILQIASFHPDYQFANCRPSDIDNYTNRSPYPTLHLLRESDIERAVAAFPDAAQIYGKNIATMRRIGLDGWRSLFAGSRPA